MRRFFLAFVFATIGSTAVAQAIIGVHVATAHFAPGYNDSNPGLYARLANGLTIGTYYNSERRTSTYVGITCTDLYKSVDVSVLVLTGYRTDPLPAIVPSKRIDLDNRFGVRISLLLPPNSAPAMHFSLEQVF